MKVVIGILIGTIFLLLLQKILQLRNLKKLNRQLIDIIENFDTNSLLRTTIQDATTTTFIENINLLIKRHKKEQQLLNKKNQALRQEVTNLSHDLRTPLTSIKGFTELLQTNLSTEERQEYTDLVLQKISGLNELIDQFYDLAKIESEDVQFQFQKNSLEQLILEAVVPFFQDFEAKQLAITIDDTFLKEKVYVDSIYMKRILSNILQNCLRYSQSYVKIYGIQNENEPLQLIIENDSPLSSIPTEKIFQRSFSVDQSRSQGQAGLGLYIAKQLMELQAGRISAEYQPPVFKIILSFPKD